MRKLPCLTVGLLTPFEIDQLVIFC